MNPLTASKLWLAEVCPGFVAQEWAPDTTSKAAERGNQIHKYLEWAVLERDDKVDAALQVMHVNRRRWVLDNLNPEFITMGLDVIDTEVTFAFNFKTDTFRYVGSHLSRAEVTRQRARDEITGTIDLLGVTRTGALVSLDYKTGNHVPEHLLPPERNLQTGFAGLAALESQYTGDRIRAIGDDRRPVVQARILFSRQLVERRGNVDQLDMKKRLRVIADEVYRDNPLRKPGAYCWMCPAYKTCDVKQESSFQW